MSFVFSRSTKKIVGMQRQARRAVFIAVRLFDTDKKATKLNRARIFTESQVCFSSKCKDSVKKQDICLRKGRHLVSPCPREGEGGPMYVKDSQKDNCVNIVLWKCVIYEYAEVIYIERAYYYYFYIFLCVKELA